tara:strand:- start:3234 stop:4592 length:1359 start_codon:yes stop_codon:yes gene_type:complete
MKLRNITYSNLIFAGLTLSTIFILVYNIFYYNPILGYDGNAHFYYVDYFSRYLPRDFKLPTPDDSREFFSPPLGYFIPSIAQVFCRNLIESSDFLNDCRPIYGNATQIFQSIMYIATIFINLLTLKRFNKSKNIFNVGYLILVSLLAVNYRTVSMIRGEPYILFFMSLFIYSICKFEQNDFRFELKPIFFTGVIIAGIALSRQWGFLLFLPLIYLYFFKEFNLKYLKLWSLCAAIGAALSSWFYIDLYRKYGSFTTFNQNFNGFSFSNQNFNFYIPNYEQLEYLFTKPIRPHLNNQFISILYSDLWGDYWGYFTFTSRFLDVGRNQLLIGDYFARVNIISIFTTLLIIIFCLLAYRANKSKFLIQYLNKAILFSFFGYLIFSIAYPNWTGDTIKSTYIIQLFHLAVFLASIYLSKLEQMNKRVFNTIITALFIIYIHNFQTYLSHFPLNYYP